MTTNYKISDFKPLIPMLYPTVFSEARVKATAGGVQIRWLGWVDNDMWISSDFIRGMLEIGRDPRVNHWLANWMRGERSRLSWGPMTLLDFSTYFSTIIPTVRQNIDLLLPVLLDVEVYRSYDEWGEPRWGGLGMSHTFSHVLADAKVVSDTSFAKRSLRSDILCCEGKTKIVDKQCRISHLSYLCGFCLMVLEEEGVLLFDEYGKSLSFCHFEFTKRVQRLMFQNESLWREHLEALRTGQPLMSSIQEGISLYVPSPEGNDT
eukprot:CAMPEP_0182440944 /NCGR_PEP_ID=MMETSP1167-20130531/87394_1 /TAXON_ID=2988 /ORGANISM="Mallomonas Sp, Strain CCMP3275" /LENGTH=262 /DNA_ID=CAMNT_0024635053 /DNA_START=260 /DNA_END=1045 /DNA_ORIENTATION=-